MKIPLPKQVAQIFTAVNELSAEYPGRSFTPDGHLVGSLGEVVAEKALNLKLYPASHPVHDAEDPEGRQVQIKMTSKRSISMYGPSERLVVLQIVDPQTAQIVFDGDGSAAWDNAGQMSKNGQRSISFFRLKKLEGWCGGV